MHNAPSVSFPVVRSRFMGKALAILWMLGAGVTALGWHQAPPTAWHVVVACAMLLLPAVMARHLWRTLPEGELRWDGRTWTMSGVPMSPAGLSVHLDLQRHLLVRLRDVTVSDQWLWLSATSSPGRWDDLRRAIHSRAMTDTRPDLAKP